RSPGEGLFRRNGERRWGVLSFRPDVLDGGRSPQRKQRLGGRHEAVDDALAAALLELDLELGPFLVDDLPISELLVEHARADCDVGARFGREAGGAAAGLRQALGDGVVAGRKGALPSGAARLAAVGSRGADVSERVFLLLPVGAPERCAA